MELEDNGSTCPITALDGGPVEGVRIQKEAAAARSIEWLDVIVRRHVGVREAREAKRPSRVEMGNVVGVSGDEGGAAVERPYGVQVDEEFLRHVGHTPCSR